MTLFACIFSIGLLCQKGAQDTTLAPRSLGPVLSDKLVSEMVRVLPKCVMNLARYEMIIDNKVFWS